MNAGSVVSWLVGALKHQTAAGTTCKTIESAITTISIIYLNFEDFGDSIVGGDGGRVASAFQEAPVRRQRFEARQTFVLDATHKTGLEDEAL